MFTDHKPLIFAFAKVSDPWSARQQRHLAAISEFSTTIQHVAGKNNQVADALSRVNVDATISTQPGIDYESLAEHQTDEEILDTVTESSINLQSVKLGNSDIAIDCDISTGKPRPIVPHSMRRLVFDNLHGLSHPSIRATVYCVEYCVEDASEKESYSYAKTRRRESNQFGESNQFDQDEPVGVRRLLCSYRGR